MITGIIQQSDSRYTLVQLRERVEALLPKSEQVDGERYDHGQRIKAVITEVSAQPKGPSIIVSRRYARADQASCSSSRCRRSPTASWRSPNVAREPGYRSKIAVVSHADGVDPVGACVGPRGSRVRMVVSELRGEKIDIIPYNEEPARFVAKALSPARVREVLVDDENKQATVIVPDDQLSLAIGKEGQNARLAARLTGWRVDIRSETEFAKEEAELGFERGGGAGRCAAILSNGRRCPNAALPGSRYCGLPAHQALEGRRHRPGRRRVWWLRGGGGRRGRGPTVRRRGGCRRGAAAEVEAVARSLRPSRPKSARQPRTGVVVAVPQRTCVGCGAAPQGRAPPLRRGSRRARAGSRRSTEGKRCLPLPERPVRPGGDRARRLPEGTESPGPHPS